MNGITSQHSGYFEIIKPEFDDERTDGIDLLAQSSCISIHASTTRAPRGKKHSDLEVNLKPCEIMYRHGTVSNIGRLLDTLREQVEIAGNQSHKQQADVTGRIEGNTKSFRCNLATLTFAFPLPRDIDCSILYQRYYQVVGDTNNATAPALGITFENLVIEQRTSECRNEVGNDSTLDYIASLECYNILVFVSSPDGMHSNLGRTMRRLDIFAVAGRLEVDPYIPIALEYRLNSTATDGENFGKKSFPVVPPFSSFKARQEDEDEDDEIDRVLSEKLHDISVDTRKALRAKDPQSSILAEVAAADAVLNVHIPEIIMDVSSKELKGFLNILKSVIPSDGGSSPKSTTQQPPSSKDHVPSIAVSVACDTIAVSLHHKNEQEAASDWMSHVLRLDRCRLHTISGGQSMKYVRFLSHETTLYQGKRKLLLLLACGSFY